MQKYFGLSIWLAVVLLTAACEQIHEPWIQNENQLAQERMRPREKQQVLRHRLLRVQADR